MYYYFFAVFFFLAFFGRGGVGDDGVVWLLLVEWRGGLGDSPSTGGGLGERHDEIYS